MHVVRDVVAMAAVQDWTLCSTLAMGCVAILLPRSQRVTLDGSTRGRILALAL
jgi:hypothetical protein